MKLKDIYKIADSKESYTKSELSQIAQKTSKHIKGQKFKQNFYSLKVQNKITILFPIYNEASFLYFSINALLNSYLYPDTSYQIIFFFNSCTDNSFEIVNNLLGKHKNIVQQNFKNHEYKKMEDKGLDKKFFYALDGTNQFYLIQTKTKGRVNALYLGSKFAIRNKSSVIMSFDTDFILDPLAIFHLSQDSLTYISSRKETVAMTGAPIVVNKNKNSRIQNWLRNHFVWKEQSYNSLRGCCLVLEPHWLSLNIEENIVEDYVLGIKARKQGYQILVVEDARLWGYKNNYKDDIKQLRRSIIGRYQLIEHHPELKETVCNEHFFMKNYFQRLLYIKKNILQTPMYTLKWLWTFIFTEIAIRQAKKSFKNDPKQITWTPLDSSR